MLVYTNQWLRLDSSCNSHACKQRKRCSANLPTFSSPFLDSLKAFWSSFSPRLSHPTSAKSQTEATPAQEDNATKKEFCPEQEKTYKWVTLFLIYTCWKPQIIGDSCGWTVVLLAFPAGICNKYLRMGSGHSVWSQIWIMSHIHQVQIPDCEHTLLQDSNLKPAFKAFDFTLCMFRGFTMTSDS